MAELISFMQWPAIKGRYPFDIRRPDMQQSFGEIWDVALWDFENLGLFNQAAYSQVKMNDAASDADATEHKRIEQINVDEDEWEIQQRVLARLREDIISRDMISGAIGHYADELTVISAWALAEKYLNKALALLQSSLGQQTSTDHRWPVISSAYQQCGVDLAAMSGFGDADECRRLNNAIKHGGTVSSSLASSSAFTGSEGKEIRTLSLDTQRYYFGIIDFASAVLEESSKRVKAHSS